MSVGQLERRLSGFDRLRLNPRLDALEDRFVNKSAALRSAGDVVILDTSQNTAFTTTTSANNPLVMGILRHPLAIDEEGLVATGGRVDAVAVTTATRGQYLSTSTTAGKAVGSAGPTAGTFGICMQDAVGGFCPAIIFPVFSRLIAAGAISSSGMFATGVVDSAAILDGSIVNADVNASAGIVDAKLATIATADKVSLTALDINGAAEIGTGLIDADVFPMDASNSGINRKSLVTRFAVYVFSKITGGDFTINSSGVGAIGSGVIVDADISGSAAIADAKLATISTANKVGLAALDIDGSAEMGAAIADADVIPIDDGGAGTNRKALVTRIYEYVFSKISGDVTVNAAGVATLGAGVADYEEGTWTPALGGSTTYSTRIGRYTKIGRHVTIILRVAVNAAGTGSTSTFGGLPFATATLGSTVAVGFWANLALAPVYLAFYINGTTLIAAGATAANATLTSGLAIFGNGAEVNGSGVYEV